MERKTQVAAQDGQQYLTITREFDLPVALLFRAHAEPELFEQWMSHEYGTTHVTAFEARPHGDWRFETRNSEGIPVFAANGTFHDLVIDKKIVRTFEMENTPFDVQLEFLDFEALDDHRSKLTIQTVFRTTALRDQLLKMPFAQGLDAAHNRLQDVIQKKVKP